MTEQGRLGQAMAALPGLCNLPYCSDLGRGDLNSKTKKMCPAGMWKHAEGILSYYSDTYMKDHLWFWYSYDLWTMDYSYMPCELLMFGIILSCTSQTYYPKLGHKFVIHVGQTYYPKLGHKFVIHVGHVFLIPIFTLTIQCKTITTGLRLIRFIDKFRELNFLR